MSQGSKLRAWMGGFAVGALTWLFYLGATFGTIALEDRTGVDFGHFKDIFNSWPLWLGLPPIAYLIWRSRRGKERMGYAIFGMVSSLLLPVLALLVFFIVEGVPHA